jgi:molybdopterin-guanine dinucleotide biosynthesis protein A
MNNSEHTITGYILAGGKSSRMGIEKRSFDISLNNFNPLPVK